MAKHVYLYKNGDNEWIMGNMSIVESVVEIKDEFLVPYNDCKRVVVGNSVGLRTKGGFEIMKPTTVTDVVKASNGTKYASVAEFKTATQSLFVDNSQYPSGRQSRLTLEITRPANTLDYAANDVINSVVENVKKKETVTLGGTNGTVNLSIPNVANKTVEFDIDLDTTAAKFVTDYAADFLPSIVVTSSTNTIIFEAAVAGVDFADVVKAVTGDMTATIAHTTANATLSMPVFSGDVSTVDGGTCMITAAFMEAPAKFASQTMTLRLYNTIPTTLLGDNAPFVLDATDALKRNGAIEIELGAVVNSATMVSGSAVPFLTFKAASASKKIYAILTVGGAVVAPETGGKFTVVLNVTQL